MEDNERILMQLSENEDGDIRLLTNESPETVSRMLYVAMAQEGGGACMKIVASAMAMYLSILGEETTKSILKDLGRLVAILREQHLKHE